MGNICHRERESARARAREIRREMHVYMTGELIVGNICRRVLFIIRDEYATLVQVFRLQGLGCRV